jgi:hypothetical protein
VGRTIYTSVWRASLNSQLATVTHLFSAMTSILTSPWHDVALLDLPGRDPHLPPLYELKGHPNITGPHGRIIFYLADTSANGMRDLFSYAARMGVPSGGRTAAAKLGAY